MVNKEPVIEPKQDPVQEQQSPKVSTPEAAAAVYASNATVQPLLKDYDSEEPEQPMIKQELRQST